MIDTAIHTYNNIVELQQIELFKAFDELIYSEIYLFFRMRCH